MPAILWAFFILVLCGFPGDRIPNFETLNRWSADKFLHGFIFFVMYTWTWSPFHPRISGVFLVIDIILFGVLTEFLQTEVFINRYGEWTDALADGGGAMAGHIFCNRFFHRGF